MTAGPERPELGVVEEGRRCGAAEEAMDDGGAGVGPAANPPRVLLPVGWVAMAFGCPYLRATTLARPTCTSAEGDTRSHAIINHSFKPYATIDMPSSHHGRAVRLGGRTFSLASYRLWFSNKSET